MVGHDIEGDPMSHSHPNHQDVTLAAIDHLTARGGRADGEHMRKAAVIDPALREKIRRVYSVKLADPYAQQYRFWSRYVDEIDLPEWERVLSSAAHLQSIIPPSDGQH